MNDLPLMLEILVGFIGVPWFCWCTVSIFNQRQEIALMKANHEDLKEMLQVLINIFKTKK